MASRRLLLPVLLLAVGTAGLGGLAAGSPDAEPSAQTVASSESSLVPVLTAEELLTERSAARASRERQRGEARAAAEAAAAQAAAEAAAAEAAAKAEAEARARAEAEAAAAAKKKAEAQAAAAAEKKAAITKAAAAPASGGTACPVPNASFTDTYGAARSGGRSHKGTDLLAPYGSPVYAVVSGRIRTASSSLGGISLYLDGDNGETYFYAHNSANVASTGQRVAAGALIAKVGSTGNAGGTNHVHFERQVGGRSVNPYSFLRQLC